MEYIIIQSNAFSFKEFADQHPNETELTPDEYGLDGDVLYQIVIPIVVPVAIEIAKALIKYIFDKLKQKKKEKTINELKENCIRILLPNDIVIMIPLDKLEDEESLIKEVTNAISVGH